MSEATSALIQCLAVIGAGLCVAIFALAWPRPRSRRSGGKVGGGSFDVSVTGCGTRAVLVVIDAYGQRKVVTLGVDDATEDRDDLLDEAAEAVRNERWQSHEWRE